MIKRKTFFIVKSIHSSLCSILKIKLYDYKVCDYWHLKYNYDSIREYVIENLIRPLIENNSNFKSNIVFENDNMLDV